MAEGPADSIEFFGVKLKVNNPRLAALLNSDVTEDVIVIGHRARGVVTAAETEGEAAADGGDSPAAAD